MGQHHGVDLSSHDHSAGGLDYTAMFHDLANRGGGAQPFAIVKATEGLGYTNPYYTQDVAGCRAAGFATGAYHFFHPADGHGPQVTYFRQVAGDIPGALDDEATDGLAWAAITSEVNAFLAAPSELGDLHYLNGNFHGNEHPLANNPLWWPTASGAAPPNTWIQQTQGAVQGLPNGNTDVNVWTGTEQQFDTFFRTGVNVTVITAALPPGALPIKQVVAGWAGPDVTAANNELDVFMLGTDGHVYHKWYRPALGWQGPETIDASL